MAVYGILDANGLCVNAIEADEDFFANLKVCSRACVCCSPALREMTQAERVDLIEPNPGVGWSYTAIGWQPPPPPLPEITEEG